MKTTPTADSARSVTPRRKSQRKSPEMNDQISDVADMMAINQVTSAEVARANQLDSATHQFRPMPISAEAIGLPKAKSTDTTGKDSGAAAKTPESIGMKTDVTQTPDSGREKQKRNQK
uniref:Uncharacterized protein n=1 Tax=Panagrolaimus sp. JU765 TaxID=591449 RepID=A0AC34QWV4_9BILA